jgi:iron(III) transport system ATP-binding protein
LNVPLPEKVKVENLTKRFGKVIAVDAISVSIREGEFFSFLGPSGCGKSTLLRCIAGLEVPDAGDIYIGDKLVTSVSQNLIVPPERRNIGMVFQNYAVWPHMTVFQNIAYPLKIKKKNKEEIQKAVDHALELVRLQGLASRYPGELSGGQQQRVALARALVMNPEVMLLDEPLSNLDAKLREEMRFELKDLQAKTGITIIYVTHDQAESMAMSDRILVMDRGAARQIGPPREIYESPRDSFVAGFIGLTNLVPVEVLSEDEKTCVVRLPGEHELLCSSGASKKGKALLSIRPEDIRVSRSPSKGSVKGTVRRAVYLGNVVDYRISINDHELRVQTNPREAFQIGETIYLSLERNILFSI